MKLSAHHSTHITKLLLIGDSGSGKTGALASLAKAGYSLRIMDYDNGSDILYNLLKDDQEAMDRVYVEPLQDRFKAAGGKVTPIEASAWTKSVHLLSEWKGPDYNLGPITSWTDKDILVIDSATMQGRAAMRFILSMNGRLMQQPFLSDWNLAGELVLNMLGMLYSPEVKCNVIVLSHLVTVGEDISVSDPNIPGKIIKQTRPGSERTYPSALGRSVPQQIGRYFNACLLARSVPMGTGVRRMIFTDSQGIIELKNSAPRSVKKTYPIETGLAEYFAAVRTAATGDVPITKENENA
jgi:hypothetical protein